jgi:hypothetical protein
MGFNLSDRVYISGDSRLSYEQDGQIFVRHDNMQKVEALSGAENITIASAGDARFAQYIISELSRAAFIKGGIVSIRTRIKDWLLPVVDAYFTQHGYTVATFILGGTDKNTNKVVNGRRWKDMANAFTGGKGLIYVKDTVVEAIGPGVPVPDGEIPLKINNTALFSIKISQAMGVEIFDTKWGEFLIYGPEGLVREDIELKDIGRLEFSIPMNGSSQDSNDMALLNGIILSMADKYHLGSVGGSVITIQNNHDGYTYLVTGRVQVYALEDIERLQRGETLPPRVTSEITVSGSTIYRVEHGTRYKLLPVSKYRHPGSDKLFI